MSTEDTTALKIRPGHVQLLNSTDYVVSGDALAVLIHAAREGAFVTRGYCHDCGAEMLARVNGHTACAYCHPFSFAELCNFVLKDKGAFE